MVESEDFTLAGSNVSLNIKVVSDGDTTLKADLLVKVSFEAGPP